MSLSNQGLVKTIPLYSIPTEKEQSNKDCSLSNKGNYGKKVDNNKTQLVLNAEAEALQVKDRILKEANDEKELILKQALEEATKLKKEAEKTGHSLGYEAGIVQGKAKVISDYEEKLELLKEEVNLQYRMFVEETNQSLAKEKDWVVCNLIDLVETSIKKLLHDAKAIEGERVSKIVRELSDDLLGCGVVAIRVAPDKVSKINKVCEESGIIDGKRKVRVTSDALLKQTDCIIETENERLEFKLDAEIESLIKEIERVSQ